LLDSKIADLNNISAGSFAGSITAALFLQRFVEKAKSWVHFDIYAWTPAAKPGRPEGAEIQVARLLFALLEERFGKSTQIDPIEKPRKIVRRAEMHVPGPVEDEGSVFDDLSP
jgi:leucyl aminopeptidase